MGSKHFYELRATDKINVSDLAQIPTDFVFEKHFETLQKESFDCITKKAKKVKNDCPIETCICWNESKQILIIILLN